MKIITNKSVESLLKKQGITKIFSKDKDIELFEKEHAGLFDKAVPQNTMFKLFGRLIHPGDSVNFSKTGETIAFPVNLLDISVNEIVKKIIMLKPKIVIPIHDWHWKNETKEDLYKRLERYLKKFEIKFMITETGVFIKI